MLPRERVQTTIERGVPDRIPIYGWVRANLAERIGEVFGSVEAFEDHFEFDYAHLFGGPQPYPGERVVALRRELGREIEPADVLAHLPPSDVDDSDAYRPIVEGIRHHKEERARWVYVQTPGIFECLNSVFGIENHLMYLALYQDHLRQVYARQAEWNRRFAMNCIDLGVDMVHVSDDWGAQVGLMFSPETWWNLIYPAHKVTVDAVRGRGVKVSLHSDGNITQVLDGVVELGYDVVHPWQESAGMEYGLYFEKYRDSLVIMGGLDVQTTIGFGRIDHLKSEIRRVMHMFRDGGLLFCTTHFVQEHCTMDELIIAFETALQTARELAAERSR